MLLFLTQILIINKVWRYYKALINKRNEFFASHAAKTSDLLLFSLLYVVVLQLKKLRLRTRHTWNSIEFEDGMFL